MKKTAKNKIIAAFIVFLVCIAFIWAMFIYRSCSLSVLENLPPEDDKSEIVKDEKPKKESSKKEDVTPPNTKIDTEVEELETFVEDVIESKDTIGKEINPVEVIFDTLESKEPVSIYIPLVKSLFNDSNLSEVDLPKGKLYYKGSNGRMESVISKRENMIYETLISYDFKGNKVDNLEIGIIDKNSDKKRYAVISENRVSTFEITTDANGKKGKQVTNYIISPELKFNKGKTYYKIEK
jgi:hypothetical protein